MEKLTKVMKYILFLIIPLIGISLYLLPDVNEYSSILIIGIYFYLYYCFKNIKLDKGKVINIFKFRIITK